MATELVQAALAGVRARTASGLTAIFQWRSVLARLALKELKVRYKSPALGLLWAFAVPLTTSLVLALVFGRLVPVPVAGMPYFLFLIAAVFPWNCFHMTIATATTSIQDNGPLIRKTHFPRQLIPCSIVLANMINFLLALIVVCGVVWVWGVSVSTSLWLLLCAVILHAALSVGVALFVSALQAEYRDTKYVVEVGLFLWFYVTPIIYPASTMVSVAPWARYAVLLNPMAGIVSLYRVALLGWESTSVLSGVDLSTLFNWTLGVTVICGFLGWWVFSRRAPTMADVVQG